MPLSGGERRREGFGATLKNVYQDPFKWAFVKSWAIFGVGVWIAREMVGAEIMPVQQA